MQGHTSCLQALHLVFCSVAHECPDPFQSRLRTNGNQSDTACIRCVSNSHPPCPEAQTALSRSHARCVAEQQGNTMSKV